MKLGLTFLVLGILGIAQYTYWQFTPLALNYSYIVVPAEEYGQFGLKTIEMIITRDWTVGVIGLLVGLVFLAIGIYKLIKIRRQYAQQLVN